MATKIIWEKIDHLNWDNFLENSEQNSDSVGKILQNPQEMGIDLLADSYITIHTPADSSRHFGAVIVQLSDPKMFEEFVSQKISEKYRIQISQKNGFRYGISSQKILVAWNDQLAIVAKAANSVSYQNLENFFVEISQLPDEQKASKNPNFQELLAESADIVAWLPSKNFPKDLKTENSELKTLWQNRWDIDYIHVLANFEQGKAIIDSKIYLQEAAAKKISTFWETSTDYDLLSQIPADQVWAFGRFRYEVQSVKNVINGSNKAFLLQPFLLGANLNIDEFYALFKGDFLAIWAGKQEIEEKITRYELDEDFNMSPKVEVVKKQIPSFGLSFPSDPVIDKSMLAFEKNGVLSRKNDYFVVNAFYENRLAVQHKDKIFSLSTLPNVFSATPQNHELDKMLKDYPVSAYLNVSKILPELKTQEKFEGKVDLEKLLEKTQDLRFYSQSPNAGILESHLEWNFIDQNENALLQLLKILPQKTDKDVQAFLKN